MISVSVLCLITKIKHMSNYPHFTFHELTRTSHSLQNYPSLMEHVENLVNLAQVLEDIRNEYGSPIVVTSAFRTPMVNAAVGGVANSFHLQGRAADIRPNLHPSNDYYWNFQQLLDVVESFDDILEEIIVDPKSRYIHIAI